MRYIVLGAGAIGGAIGGRLFQHDRDVVLVARGEHLEVLQSKGLELRDPDGSVLLPVPAVATAADAGLRTGDVILLATKSQHSEGPLADLALHAPPEIAVVCAQNGVENERLAGRRFANTYGMRVIVAARHLEPGVVQIATQVSGLLDVGRYPAGIDAVAEEMAEDLRASGFRAIATPRVMTYKYLKLLGNLSNAIEAACGTERSPAADQLRAAARSEAQACYAAAGIEVADPADDAERRRWRGFSWPAGGPGAAGGSSWQSLQRQTGNIEADWLNGEIVLLGRLHGVPTPVNERLQAVANRLAFERTPPGSMTAEELAAGLL
jgi:2-dehydropantoate 2-reductase